MNFAPFAFENNIVTNPLPSSLTLDLWQGNYTAGSSSWASSVGGVSATMLNGGFQKTTNGVTGLNFTGTTVQTLFTISGSGGSVFTNAAGTIVIYMNITSTSNKTLWGKQNSGTNGMGVDFTNNPYYIIRTPTSSNEIRTTSTTSRGTNVYTFATAGGNDQTCQLYLNKTKPAMTRSASLGTNWNNGYDFTFGKASSWADPSIQGVLNRLMFFNTKLTDAEVSQVVDYCTANA